MAALLCTLHYPLFTGGEAAPAQVIPVAVPTIETVAGWINFGRPGGGNYRAIDEGAAATSAALAAPQDVALDGAGNLYIADTHNHRVRKVDAATGNISTVAGTTRGYSGDGAAATSAQLNEPFGVAVDGSGNLYIADLNNYRVRKVDAATGIISTVAGTGIWPYRAIDEGAAATSAQLHAVGLALDGSGNLYIADFNNHRVRKVDAATGNISTVAGTTQGYSGDGAAATSAQLNAPICVAVDEPGNLYIADRDNHRVRKVDAAGVITTVAGTGTNGYSGDGGAATAAQISEPSGLAADSLGNLYIADSNYHSIRKVDGSTGIISTVAGLGVSGYSGYSGDGGAATSAQLNQPGGIAVYSLGNLYIADRSNSRVRKVTLYRYRPPSGPEPEPAVLSQSFALSFMPAQEGESAAQTITLYAEGGAADFRAIPSARWIEAAPRSGNLAAGAQTMLTVTVNPAGLREGRHNGRLYIRSGRRVSAMVLIVLEVPPPTGPAVSESDGVFNAARMSAYGERGLFGPRLLPLAPGSAVVVQGVNFAPGGDVVEAENFPLPTMLGGARVLIDGAEAPLFSVGPRRIEAQLPWALGGEATASGGLALATVVVESGGVRSWPRQFWAAPHAPGVFTVSGEGQGQALVLFQGTAALAAPLGAGSRPARAGEVLDTYSPGLGAGAGSRPARGGDVLEIYATGLGAVEPPLADSMNSCAPDGVCLADGSNAVLRHTAARPQVWIGAYELAAENIRFSGLAPDMAGVNLVVVEVPRNLAPSAAAELRLAVAGRMSQSGVTVAIE